MSYVHRRPGIQHPVNSHDVELPTAYMLNWAPCPPPWCTFSDFLRFVVTLNVSMSLNISLPEIEHIALRCDMKLTPREVTSSTRRPSTVTTGSNPVVDGIDGHAAAEASTSLNLILIICSVFVLFLCGFGLYIYRRRKRDQPYKRPQHGGLGKLSRNLSQRPSSNDTEYASKTKVNQMEMCPLCIEADVTSGINYHNTLSIKKSGGNENDDKLKDVPYIDDDEDACHQTEKDPALLETVLGVG